MQLRFRDHLEVNCLEAWEYCLIKSSLSTKCSFTVEVYSFSGALSLIVWPSCLKFNFLLLLEKLKIIQNKAVKFIKGGKFLAQVYVILFKTKHFEISDLHKFELAKLVDRFMHSTLILGEEI